MGYNHFALLATAEPLETKDYDLLAAVCKKISLEPEFKDDPPFGKVYHLSSGGFSDWWFEKFDKYVLQLYTACSCAKALYLYVCTFDGSSLAKYTYFEGVRADKAKEITVETSDSCVRTYWQMDGLVVKNNITILCNKDYVYDYEPED